MALPFLKASEGPKTKWRLPELTERVSVVGKTGSGKTTAGLAILGMMNPFEHMPWIIIDYKRDSIIEQIPARILREGSSPPTDPGLYKLECSPFLSDQDPVEAFLNEVWHNQNTGLFFDEAYMLPDRFGRTSRGTLRVLYTTGRSRHIPIISLTQRPVDVTKYNFSEADHHVLFRLTDKADRDIVRGRVPNEHFDEIFGKSGTGLPKYHSMWYDVSQDTVTKMLPFPAPKDVIGMFAHLAKKNQWT